MTMPSELLTRIIIANGVALVFALIAGSMSDASPILSGM
jgi:hypothetical protein